ncbi:MAG TPA: ABC transporter permease [Thermoanaerobaculia bacterium]|nr:ABC transporter permease [Thermoanaerobaculia bacterium]
MRTPLVATLAWRYVRGRRSLLLHGTARAALVSTSLGVTTMVIAMALMTGYSEDLQRKLIGGSAAIVAYALDDSRPSPAQIEALAALRGVSSVDEVAYGQGSLSRLEDPRPLEVTLRGLDAEQLERGAATPHGAPPDRASPGAARPSDLAPSSAPPDGVAPILLGRELERRLGAQRGEILRLVAVDLQDLRFRYRRVRHAGSFESGFAEADAGWVMIDRAVVAELGGRSSLLEIGLTDPLATAAVGRQVEDLLGDVFLVTDWRQFNRELFTALRLQKMALFLVLGLIVVVATFNVASTLVVLTRERRREVGVLSALGLGRRELTGVFLLCGVALGAVGSVLGVALGWLVSWLLTTYELVRFDPGVAAIYFISSVPFRVEPADVASVLLFTLLATFIACWIPAWRGAALDPGEALRYD